MKKTKLIQVLEIFEARELTKLRKFLNSPYFNSNNQIISLFEHYVKNQNKEQNANTNQEIWKLIKANGSYNEVRFRKYQSDLTKLVVQFIATEDFQNDKFSLDLHSIRAVRKRNVKPLINSLLKSISNPIQKEQKYSPEYLLFKIQIEKERYLIEHKGNRTESSNLATILDNLDQFYFSEKFKFATDLNSRTKMVKRETNISLINEILEFVKESPELLSPIGQIYRLVYLTQVSNSNKITYYTELETLLAEVSSKIDKAEVNAIYTSLINFCIGRINNGEREFQQKLLSIYKSLIALNLIVENNKITPTKYRNITITALRQGESDWAEEFALKFSEYLPENIRENQLRFLLGATYFYKKEFDKVIEYLKDFEFNDLFDSLITKAVLVQTYYELKEFDALDSLLRSLRTYITRHKELDSGRRLNYKNLIKIMSQLIQVIPGDQKKIDKIKNSFSEMKGTAVNRAWIEEKIAELEK